MRPKLNPEGTSVLIFIQQVADRMKQHGESVEQAAEALYGPNLASQYEQKEGE